MQDKFILLKQNFYHAHNYKYGLIVNIFFIKICFFFRAIWYNQAHLISSAGVPNNIFHRFAFKKININIKYVFKIALENVFKDKFLLTFYY